MEFEKSSYWLCYDKESGFYESEKPSKNREANREVWARFFELCVKKVGSSEKVRALWNESLHRRVKKQVLPRIIRQDAFLVHHTLGLPLRVRIAKNLWEKINSESLAKLNPIKVYWNDRSSQFFDVVGAPPGVLAKFVRAIRLRRDSVLLQRIESDFRLVAEIENDHHRKSLTLAILSHAVAYRELAGQQISIPSFTQPHTLINYSCYQHLIDQGVKTISLMPPKTAPNACGIYLCQGTEIWPSQRSALGTIVANFAIHGSATQAYAHSWRRIHKHLKDLGRDRPLPIITGHSMGGSLAIQVALYAHDLIQESHAFNPPMPNERDHAFYCKLPKPVQNKMHVHANLDDFAFWRIGSKVIGQVTLYFGKVRWRYYPISLINALTLFPAIVKLILNLKHAFPAHQHVFAFDEHCIMVQLSEEEIALENKERAKRFDYLHFFPKLYDPMRVLMKFIRRILGWSLKEEFFRNELEIVMLHERDLHESGGTELELAELKREREQLLRKIAKIKS